MNVMKTVKSVFDRGYLGNSKLRRPGVQIQWTQEQQIEFARCMNDPVYFMETYVKIVHVDKGLINFKPRKFQKDIARSVTNNRFTIVLASRQTGKTTSVAATVLHYIIFNEAKTVAILANKGDTAREIMKRVQDAYENLPKWMQHGVIEYNKGSFELENGSRVLAAASGSSAIRGYAISFLLVDECAFVENFDQFWSSVYPTISSGQETKVVLISTPNGYNHFNAFWNDANEEPDAKGCGKNSFYPIQVTWKDIPERNNAAWEKRERSVLGDTKFEQEHECSFIGSVMTLISPKKLLALRSKSPEFNNQDLRIYDRIIPTKAQYMLVADVSHGKGLDDHAFSIIRVDEQPFAQVAAFHNNLISPIEYGEVIWRTAKQFNDAFVLIELNDMGSQVARVLTHDLEYENVIYSMAMGRKGQVPCFLHPKAEAGVRTSKTTKAIGCNMLKNMIEHDRLVVKDLETISQLTRFVRSDKVTESYAAQAGGKDDCVMPLVLFGWLANSPFFGNFVDVELRNQLRQDSERLIDEMGAPIAMILRQSVPTEQYERLEGDKNLWLRDDRDDDNLIRRDDFSVFL